MDQDKTPGIQPLPLGQPVNNASAAAQPASTAAPSLDERVDQWLDKHPDTKSFSEEKTSAPSSTEPTEPEPHVAPTVVPPGGDDVPGTTPSPPAGTPDKPAETPQPVPTPQAKAPTVEPPKPAAPAEPVRFALDAKYKFAEDGPEWTGQQVVDGLRERYALLPKAQEADVYAEVFEMPAAQAKELWAPNIAWMKQNPQQIEMLASIIDDPVKASYILDCSRYWESPEGQQIRSQQQQPPPKQALSPEVEARIKQVEAQNKQLLDAENLRRNAQAHERLARDLNVAYSRYPFLRENPALVKSLAARAWMINGGDDSPNSKGILDAIDEQKVLYDAQLAALNQASTIARQAGTPPAPVEVPPLMGSGGASPSATQPMRVAQPKKFTNLDDAVDEWVSNPPSQFR